MEINRVVRLWMGMENRPIKEFDEVEAQRRLDEILDDVERGQTVAIRRNGERIGRIVPEAEAREAEINQAVRGIKELRRQTKPATVEEILAWRDEGRK